MDVVGVRSVSNNSQTNYQPQEAAKTAGKSPLPSSLPPLINPIDPSRIPQVSPDQKRWQELVQNYGKVAGPWDEAHQKEIKDLEDQAGMLKAEDPSYKEKFLVLIERQDQLIEELRQSPESRALLKEAEDLFNRAFKFDPESGDLGIDPRAKQDLDAFLELTAQAGIDDPKFIELARRANPDLGTEEHKLIHLYQRAETIEARLAVLNKIIVRFKTLAKREMDEYDGWVSTSQSPALKILNAFWWALNGVIKPQDVASVDQLLAGYNLEISRNYIKTIGGLKSYLSASDGGIAKKTQVLRNLERYLETKSEDIKRSLLANKATILSIIEDAQYAQDRTPLGEEKITAYRLNRVLYDIALAIGLTAKDIELQSLTASLPKFKEIEGHYEFLANFSQAKESPERVDNYQNRETLTKKIEEVYREMLKARTEYLNAPSAEMQQRYSSLEALLGRYASFAPDFGISKEDLDRIFVQYLPAIRQPVTLAEVREKGVVAVAPEALPVEVQRMLMDTEVPEEIKRYLGKSGKYTYFDMVKENIRTINLIRGIKESEAQLKTTGEEGGHAVPYLRSIWLDVDNMPAWLIARIIVHETDHVITSWKYYDRPEFQRSTPNERHAYLSGVRFLVISLYNNWDSLKPEERWQMAEVILSDRKAGLAANRPLGLAPVDAELAMKLPERSEERDLDTYPTNLAASYQEELEQIFGKGEEVKSPGEIFEAILNGKIKIKREVKLGKVWLIGQNGKKVEAPKENNIWIPLQVVFGLKPDGKLGPQTLAKLYELSQSKARSGYFEFGPQELTFILQSLGAALILRSLEEKQEALKAVQQVKKACEDLEKKLYIKEATIGNIAHK